MPVLLCVHLLWDDAAAQAGRLLRVLFVRFGSMPANPGRAVGGAWRIAMLRRIGPRNEIDWIRSALQPMPKVFSPDAYWEMLEPHLRRFSPDEQRAAIALNRELAKGEAVDSARLATALGV